MGARAGESIGEAPRAMSLAQVFSAVRDDLRDRATRVSFETSLDLATMSLHAPPRALTQVLVILVNNALDAHSDANQSALVRLIARNERAGLALEIVDRGPGISPDRLDRIGEPFYTTKPPGRGLGLGVFLALAFADRVGGKLDLRSTVGDGTTATLWIPTNLDALRSPQPHATPLTEPA
jgi:two-component system sensor histidine kinase RegB